MSVIINKDEHFLVDISLLELQTKEEPISIVSKAFGNIKILDDDSMPDNEVHFRDKRGKLVGRIIL